MDFITSFITSVLSFSGFITSFIPSFSPLGQFIPSFIPSFLPLERFIPSFLPQCPLLRTLLHHKYDFGIVSSYILRFVAVGIRGNLSPPVLAKNKGTAVFRLVSARTDFSSEKSSCSGPTSEGICFAKQSEQWATEPMLSQGEVSGSVPLFQQPQNAVSQDAPTIQNHPLSP